VQPRGVTLPLPVAHWDEYEPQFPTSSTSRCVIVSMLPIGKLGI
jgi:hypothetical protein